MNRSSTRDLVRTIASIVAALSLAAGTATSSAETPTLGPDGIENFRCPKPNSRAFSLRDATAAVEYQEHLDLIKDGSEIIAQHFPVFITPYSKHEDGSGTYYTPDLWALAVPLPFFAVFPGKIESIIDDHGKQVPQEIVDSLRTHVAAMDGDHDNVKSSAYALRVPLPDGMWRVKEVRGYVYAIIGVNSEWTNLGRVPFKTGGKAVGPAHFEFTEVTPLPDGKGAKFRAVTDPSDIVTAAEVSFGDVRTGCHATAGSGGWNPTPDSAAKPEKQFGPINGVYRCASGAPLPQDARVRVRLVNAGKLVKIPFVFSNGSDVALVGGESSKPVDPNNTVNVAPGPHASGYAFRVVVQEFRDPPKPTPIVAQVPPPKKAAPAAPAATSNKPVERPLPFWHTALGQAFAVLPLDGRPIVPPGERAVGYVPVATVSGAPNTPSALSTATPAPTTPNSPAPAAAPTPVTTASVTSVAPPGDAVTPQAAPSDPAPGPPIVLEQATGEYQVDELYDPAAEAEAGRVK